MPGICLFLCLLAMLVRVCMPQQTEPAVIDGDMLSEM